MVKYADNICYRTKNQLRGLCIGGDICLVRSMLKWPYLRLRTTHALDFWYSNRYCQLLLPYQKSGRWVVRRQNFNIATRNSQKISGKLFYKITKKELSFSSLNCESIKCVGGVFFAWVLNPQASGQSDTTRQRRKHSPQSVRRKQRHMGGFQRFLTQKIYLPIYKYNG